MILDSFGLSGKISSLTCASSGIGQAMALGLAEAGADIIAMSRSDNEDNQAPQALTENVN